MKNLVLIGMPGSGKSSVGRTISNELNMEFAETDQLIVKKMCMSIPKIFSKWGEDRFREIETEIAVEVSQKSGLVISTGGGIILREENMKALKNGGVVLFLDRDINEIASSKLIGRPLIDGDTQKIFDLYEQRIELYRKYADFTIKCLETVEQTSDAVIKLIKDGSII